MFIRKPKNRSGSVSVQIISKQAGKSKVVKTIGSATGEQQIAILVHRAKQKGFCIIVETLLPGYVFIFHSIN